jgi:regulator of RNase E activity RraA
MSVTQRLPIRCLSHSSQPQIRCLRLSSSPPRAKLSRGMTTSKPSPDQLQTLKNYTACDISDALLKLKVPNCGFLPDLSLFSPASRPTGSQITIAPASTVLFGPKHAADLSAYPAANIPDGKHWVDLTEPESIVLISQPRGQICAALGGIMALRMKMRNAAGVVVHGRVRDVEELRETGLPVGQFFFCLLTSLFPGICANSSSSLIWAVD